MTACPKFTSYPICMSIYLHPSRSIIRFGIHTTFDVNAPYRQTSLFSACHTICVLITLRLTASTDYYLQSSIHPQGLYKSYNPLAELFCEAMGLNTPRSHFFSFRHRPVVTRRFIQEVVLYGILLV